MNSSHPERRTALVVALAYLLLSAAWIFGSDYWLQPAPVAAPPLAHTLGDVVFLVVTAVLLHEVVGRSLRRASRADERSQAALESGEERYRDLFESATDILSTHAFDGTLTALNRAGELATGIPHEAAAGRPLSELFVPEDTDVARRLLQRARLDDAPARAELRLRGQHGDAIPVEVTAHTFEHRGKPVGILCIARDVRERQALESQLRQSQKMEAIGRLASGVAHDFNNVLTAISGYSELSLSRVRQGEPLHRDLMGIRAATERAAALTRQLLALSRRQAVSRRLVDLHAVLADLGPILPRLLGEDIELELHAEAQPSTVLADLGQLEQVILTLCVRARDAMPRGGKLRLSTSNADWGTPVAPGPGAAVSDAYVVLTVADDGEGMDAETRARVFEPDFSASRAGDDGGLLLPVVYGIVRQSGGAITVDSAVGQGTSFRVLLPLAVADGTVAPGSATDVPRAGHETILLVEDDELVRELSRRFLQRYRYRVLEAPDAAAARTLWQEHGPRIDLLLTDVVMPGTNGLKLAEELRASRPELKVVFVSGYADSALLPLGLAEPVLHKPFTELDLARQVRRSLDQPSAPSPGNGHGAGPTAGTPTGPMTALAAREEC